MQHDWSGRHAFVKLRPLQPLGHMTGELCLLFLLEEKKKRSDAGFPPNKSPGAAALKIPVFPGRESPERRRPLASR